MLSPEFLALPFCIRPSSPSIILRVSRLINLTTLSSDFSDPPVTQLRLIYLCRCLLPSAADAIHTEMAKLDITDLANVSASHISATFAGDLLTYANVLRTRLEDVVTRDDISHPISSEIDDLFTAMQDFMREPQMGFPLSLDDEQPIAKPRSFGGRARAPTPVPLQPDASDNTDNNVESPALASSVDNAADAGDAADDDKQADDEEKADSQSQHSAHIDHVDLTTICDENSEGANLTTLDVNALLNACQAADCPADSASTNAASEGA